ncbi:MAG: alpha-amylase family glycosyl hydrolase [Elusimicrobiota bacterium]|jgi:glycosidase
MIHRLPRRWLLALLPAALLAFQQGVFVSGASAQQNVSQGQTGVNAGTGVQGAVGTVPSVQLGNLPVNTAAPLMGSVLPSVGAHPNVIEGMSRAAKSVPAGNTPFVLYPVDVQKQSIHDVPAASLPRVAASVTSDASKVFGETAKGAAKSVGQGQSKTSAIPDVGPAGSVADAPAAQTPEPSGVSGVIHGASGVVEKLQDPFDTRNDHPSTPAKKKGKRVVSGKDEVGWADMPEEPAEAPSSLADVSLEVPAGAKYTPSPEDWRDGIIYSLVIDRFGRAAPYMTWGDPADGRTRHGGNIRGLIERLDYLQNLGVQHILINPVTMSPPAGYHQYWPVHFMAVDPQIGTMADFKELVAEAHKRGMTVILDWIANHAGPVLEYEGGYKFGAPKPIKKMNYPIKPVELQDRKGSSNWFDEMLGGPAKRVAESNWLLLQSIPGIKGLKVERGRHYFVNGDQWGIRLEAAGDADIQVIREALKPYLHSGAAISVYCNGFLLYALYDGNESDASRQPDPRMERHQKPKGLLDALRGGLAKRFAAANGEALRKIPGVTAAEAVKDYLWIIDEQEWGFRIDIARDADLREVVKALEPYRYDGVPIAVFRSVEDGPLLQYAMSGGGQNTHLHPEAEEPPNPVNQHFHRRGSIDDWNNHEQVMNGDFPGGLNQLATENPSTQDILLTVAKWWMKETDIDGYRLDTYMHVNPAFWSRFFKEVREYAGKLGKKNFLILGELYHGDPNALKPELGNGRLDAAYNYPAYFWDEAALHGQAPTSILEQSFRQIGAALGRGINYLVRFLDNQDKPRFLRPNDPVGILKVALAYTLMTVGIPYVYYGTEHAFRQNPGVDLGMDGYREDMFPEGKFKTPSSKGDNFDPKDPVYQHLRAMADIRKAHPALRRGEQFVRWSDPNGPGIFAFSRILGDEEVVVVLNTADAARSAEMWVDAKLTPPGTELVDAMNPGNDYRSYAKDGGSKLYVNIPPHGVRILVRRKS